MFHSQKRLAQCWWVLKLSYKAKIGYLFGIHLLSVSLHLFSNTVHFLPLDRNIEETGRGNVYVPRENRKRIKDLFTIMPSFTWDSKWEPCLEADDSVPLYHNSQVKTVPAHKDIWISGVCQILPMPWVTINNNSVVIVYTINETEQY